MRKAGKGRTFCCYNCGRVFTTVKYGFKEVLINTDYYRAICPFCFTFATELGRRTPLSLSSSLRELLIRNLKEMKGENAE